MSDRSLKAISLFSGIGGIDVGLSSAGFDIIAQVEIDEYCQQVLKKHAPKWWPNAVIHADAGQFGSAAISERTTDIISAGFPCQPFSEAGKQRGADDNRNMWPETARIIGEIQPRAILLENVTGLITRTGDTPGYVGTVLTDLSKMGYVGAWGVISAADVGASHIRERVWIVAYHHAIRRQKQSSQSNTTAHKKWNLQTRHRARTVSNAFKPSRKTVGSRKKRAPKPGLDRAIYGVPGWLDRPKYPATQGTYQYQWEASRTVSEPQPHWKPRVQALGNAVMPQIAYAIAKEIKKTLEMR